MNKTLTRMISAAALTGALVAAAAGTASAATTAPVHQSPAQAAALTTQIAPRPMSSEGIQLMNATPYVLVLTGVVGDNEGVPTIGAPLCPNVGYQDFEVTWHAAAINEVSATYDVDEGRFGTKVGTAQVNMTVDAIGNVNTSGVMVLDQGGAHALNISASDTKFPQILS